MSNWSAGGGGRGRDAGEERDTVRKQSSLISLVRRYRVFAPTGFLSVRGGRA